jgi:hypothetical protein
MGLKKHKIIEAMARQRLIGIIRCVSEEEVVEPVQDVIGRRGVQ